MVALVIGNDIQLLFSLDRYYKSIDDVIFFLIFNF